MANLAQVLRLRHYGNIKGIELFRKAKAMSPVNPSFDPENLYFITTTSVNRSHLFTPDKHKQIIADSLVYMRQKGWFNLYAFVIMPNHIHLIVKFFSPYNLSNVMRDFKKYTSKQIVRNCRAENLRELLSYIESAGEAGAKSQYKVWEEGYDVREVFSISFLEQKLDYIHHNPCQPHWGLVEKPDDYLWSSACFYMEDRPTIIDIDDLRELLVP